MISAKGLKKLILHPRSFVRDYLKKTLSEKSKKIIKGRMNKTAKSFEEYQFNSFERYTHLLHTGENVTGLSHLDLWIPVFIKADINFAVMVRNYELFLLIKEKYPQITLIFAKGAKEVSNYLDKMLLLKACFYPSNTGNNLHLLKYNDIKHIFIGHGDSDKTASAHKYFRVYDENWVAGEAHIDRFRNEGFDFDGLKKIKVGRPNLKETLLLSEIHWRERFDGKLKLLYLSTWEGFFQEQNYTSVYIIKDFFSKELIGEVFSEIYIKLHPGIGRRDVSLLNFPKKLENLFREKEIDATIFDKTVPVETLIKESNIFICDISAVVSECLSANAPIFVYIPKDKEIKLSQSEMSYEDYTYTFSNIEELLEKIKKVIVENNDYLSEKREEAMEYILGKKETLDDEFINQLKRI